MWPGHKTLAHTHQKFYSRSKRHITHDLYFPLSLHRMETNCVFYVFKRYSTTKHSTKYRSTNTNYLLTYVYGAVLPPEELDGGAEVDLGAGHVLGVGGQPGVAGRGAEGEQVVTVQAQNAIHCQSERCQGQPTVSRHFN